MQTLIVVEEDEWSLYVISKFSMINMFYFRNKRKTMQVLELHLAWASSLDRGQRCPPCSGTAPRPPPCSSVRSSRTGPARRRWCCPDLESGCCPWTRWRWCHWCGSASGTAPERHGPQTDFSDCPPGASVSLFCPWRLSREARSLGQVGVLGESSLNCFCALRGTLTKGEGTRT